MTPPAIRSIYGAMGMYACPCLLALATFVGCSKSNSNSSSSPTTSTTASTTAATAPASTRPADDAGSEHSLPPMVDERLHPSVYLSVNNHSTADLPQGWPIIIRATIFGGRGQPIDFTADDVTLRITGAKGQPANWPLKRATLRATTQPSTAPVAKQVTTTMMANDTSPAFQAWVLTDSSSIPVGTYHLNATVKDLAQRDIDLTIAAPPPQLTDEQQTTRFHMQARAAFAMNDPQSALTQAEARLQTKPVDLPALHVKADALAALGRTREATAAYARALDEFYSEYPHAPEPPLELLYGLYSLSAEKR